MQGPVLKSEQDTGLALRDLSAQVDLDFRTGCFSPEGRCSDQGGTGALGDSVWS